MLLEGDYGRILIVPFVSSTPLTERLLQAAADFKERPWGNINFRLNETFDAVGTMAF